MCRRVQSAKLWLLGPRQLNTNGPSIVQRWVCGNCTLDPVTTPGVVRNRGLSRLAGLTADQRDHPSQMLSAGPNPHTTNTGGLARRCGPRGAVRVRPSPPQGWGRYPRPWAQGARPSRGARFSVGLCCGALGVWSFGALSETGPGSGQTWKLSRLGDSFKFEKFRSSLGDSLRSLLKYLTS